MDATTTAALGATGVGGDITINANDDVDIGAAVITTGAITIAVTGTSTSGTALQLSLLRPRLW